MIQKILHTSDWHIGHQLRNHERYEEFKKFFAWLESLIQSENIDVILVAGDIFDNMTPSTKAQNLYYSFLSCIVKLGCKHIVITSGNHDLPTFLEAPKDLLELFKIHVVGKVCKNVEDEVLILDDNLIICAIPYLRERDVRDFESENSLVNGIKKHYEKVFEHALKLKLNNKNTKIPILAMGHLFVRGGKISDDYGVRPLYVGNSVEVGSDIFPEFLTYTALGHLHSPQKIKRENIRYSGSPLVMDFGEINQKKAVNIIELDGEKLMSIKEVSVPTFQRMERITGTIEEIFYKLSCLQKDCSIWLEIIYSGNEAIGDLQEKIDEFVKSYPLLEILSIRDESQALKDEKFSYKNSGKLERFTPVEIFEKCLEFNNISPEQRKIFISMYNEILPD